MQGMQIKIDKEIDIEFGMSQSNEPTKEFSFIFQLISIKSSTERVEKEEDGDAQCSVFI